MQQTNEDRKRRKIHALRLRIGERRASMSFSAVLTR